MKEDNRNLGTLDLLDTSGSENDESLDKIKKDVKGKGKMVLEEEDWMKEENQIIQLEAKGEKEKRNWPEFKPTLGEERKGEPSESIQSKEMVRGGSKDQNAKGTGSFKKDPDQAKGSTTTGTGVGETIELSDDSEDDMQVEGGLTCPMCKMDLETLPIKVSVPSPLVSCPSALTRKTWSYHRNAILMSEHVSIQLPSHLLPMNLSLQPPPLDPPRFSNEDFSHPSPAYSPASNPRPPLLPRPNLLPHPLPLFNPRNLSLPLSRTHSLHSWPATPSLLNGKKPMSHRNKKVVCQKERIEKYLFTNGLMGCK